MIDEKQKAYLQEHLPYELKMLRYTYGQLLQKQHCLSWNAHFESFAVHARNLVNFLTNGDTGNFNAKDFVKDHKASIGDQSGAMQRLRDQVFHLGKRRPTDAKGKFSRDSDAQKVRAWIETNFADFLGKLPNDLRPLFNDNKADPTKEDEAIPRAAAAPQTDSAVPPLGVQNATT